MSSGATSFVSVVESDSEGVDRQNLADQFNESRNAQIRSDLETIDARVSGVIELQNQFQTEAKLFGESSG